jgi:dolichol kinase
MGAREPAGYSEMKRKVEHITPLAFAFTLTIFPKGLIFVLAILSIIYGLFVSKRVVKGTLREHEITKGFSLGKAAYGIMIFLLLVMFNRRMYVVAGAWALLALGDGSASIFGSMYGTRKLPWNKDKSWAGLIAFLVVGTLACTFFLWYIQATGDVGRTMDNAFVNLDLGMLFTIGALTAFACAVAETIRQPIDDNILVPGLAAVLISLLSKAL